MRQFSRTYTSVIHGLNAQTVEVEVELSRGKPFFGIIGLADSAVREARDRVSTALQASGFEMPQRVLVNLAPAELRKEGAALDLPIAAGILKASSQCNPDNSANMYIHGELSLDGYVKPVRGTIAFVVEAVEQGARTVILPHVNVREATLVEGVEVVGVRSLHDLQRALNGEVGFTEALGLGPTCNTYDRPQPLFSDIWGQETAKRGLLIAAAGGHNILMSGPPGCGKSLLASRAPFLLPTLSAEEIREVARIHSIAGKSIDAILVGVPPFCAPHQGVSEAGLIGGGSANPTPGDISLAHKGVLFLDELPEYRKSVLEALRGPLENGEVMLRRAKYGVRFPAQFQLVAAMNPCPCGRLGAYGLTCQCSETALRSYAQKISQPLLDRIDIHVSLRGIPPDVLLRPTDEINNDDQIKETILKARVIQQQRQLALNARLRGRHLISQLLLTKAAARLVEHSVTKLSFSARTYSKLLRVARTIADISEEEYVDERGVAEALSFRGYQSFGL
jgi:magnesium chelatase family protein